ncbi:violaxanthin de-epoxidase, chloroplastic [Tanacetum coccineum]
MVSNCGQQVLNCLLDPNCKKALQCLNKCSPVDQVCNYQCLASYESPTLEEFSLCVLQKHNCLDLDAKIPEKPFVPPMVKFQEKILSHEIAKDLFVGWLGNLDWSWRVVAGQNPRTISSRVNTNFFIGEKQRAHFGMNLFFKFFQVKTLDGKLVWRRRKYRVKRGKVAGTFYFSVLDNGVVSNEYWTTVDVSEDFSWGLFHYSGIGIDAVSKIMELLFDVDNCQCNDPPLGLPEGSRFTTTLTAIPNDILGDSPATSRWGYLSLATCRWGIVAGERFLGIRSPATIPSDKDRDPCRDMMLLFYYTRFCVLSGSGNVPWDQFPKLKYILIPTLRPGLVSIVRFFPSAAGCRRGIFVQSEDSIYSFLSLPLYDDSMSRYTLRCSMGMSRICFVVHVDLGIGVDMLLLYIKIVHTDEFDIYFLLDLPLSDDSLLSLHIRCLTDESIGYRCTSDIQRMSRYAIVVHKMFNECVDMLSLYFRCSTDDSICYRCTSHVQRMSRYAIVVHQMFNG